MAAESLSLSALSVLCYDPAHLFGDNFHAVCFTTQSGREFRRMDTGWSATSRAFVQSIGSDEWCLSHAQHKKVLKKPST